ncbi:MAG: hypothetical protein GY941_11830 [Planctomycetes bacterium]|nr:hypothetical protein [Planctomycetota bacterium]
MLNTKRPLLVVYVLFLLLISMFTARTVISDTFKVFREGVVKDLQGIAEKQAKVIGEYLENEEKNIKVVAYDLHRYYAKSDDTKALEYLVSVQNIYHYKEVFVANTEGDVVLSSESDNVRATVSSKQYFINAMNGETCISDIISSEVPIENEKGQLELGMPTMFVSTPILDANAQIMGVLVFRLDINQINALMFKMRATDTAEIYLINKNGYMLTKSRFTDALELGSVIEKRTTLELKVTNPNTNSLTLAATKCIAGGKGFNDSVYGYVDYRGTRVLGYWIWMEEYSWGVIAEIDLEESCEDIRKYFQDITIKNLRGLMRQHISFIKNRMDKYKNDALSIAHKPQSLQYTKGVLSIEEFIIASNYLEFLRDEHKYKEIFICNSEGIVMLTTEKRFMGKDISGEDYFVKAKENDVFVTDIKQTKLFSSNKAVRAKYDVPTMLVSAKVKHSNGDFAGVVTLRVDLEDFNKLMQSTEIGASGEMYLINTDGFLVTESRFVHLLKRKGMVKERTALELRGINPKTGRLTKAVEACMRGEGFSESEYYDYRGVFVLGTWDWIPEYEWGIIVEIDLTESFYKSASFWGIKQYF